MGYDGTLTLLDNGKVTDITPKELLVIEKFKEDGKPGLAALVTDENSVKMTKAFDLYLSGSTYQEISKVVSLKKDIILYLAQKHGWYETKIEVLEILAANMKERVVHAHLTNQHFVLQIQQFYLKKIGSKITRYLATGDDEIAAKIDGKDIDRYAKYVDLLDKMTTEKIPSGSRPSVGLNMGEFGVNVRKVGENEVQITPRNKTNAQMLQELANIKRAEESSEKPVNDINNKDAENNSETKEKEEK